MYVLLLNNMWRVHTGFEVGVDLMEAQFVSQYRVKYRMAPKRKFTGKIFADVGHSHVIEYENT